MAPSSQCRCASILEQETCISEQDTDSDLESQYETLDYVLGTGASGNVQTAVCRRTGRPVAVKTYRKYEMSATGLQNMRREVEIHSLQSHPNIVSFAGAYETEEALHIVTEHLNGGELFDRVAEKGQFSESEAASSAFQVLHAVAHLHAQGVVHRDIKLDNLLYVQNSGRHLRLIDFGFAARLHSKDLEPCGSLQSVAPEVISHQAWDEKSDLWSVGSVVYTLLTGCQPFAGDADEIISKNKAGQVDFVEEFDYLSNDAQDFVRALLHPDPQKRPSAREALLHPWLLCAVEAFEDEILQQKDEILHQQAQTDILPMRCGDVNMREAVFRVMTCGVVGLCMSRRPFPAVRNLWRR